MKLQPRQVEKPWGRERIPSVFGPTNGKRIGEIWFEQPTGDDLPLLAKYIFTSERLSIQVHPDDDQARARGFERGKNECWYILDAVPGATLGLGLIRDLSAQQLRSAALDGSIEGLMDWLPVASGEFYFVPPGTVHAIGAGISLLEFQQNVDLTYRLYDYGRPRELHLDDAVAVSRRGRYPDAYAKRSLSVIDAILLDNPVFSVVRVSGPSRQLDRLRARRRWVMPLQGLIVGGNLTATPGECLLVDPGVVLEPGSDAIVLVGIEGECPSARSL